jgi:hypothetical protein
MRKFRLLGNPIRSKDTIGFCPECHDLIELPTIYHVGKVFTFGKKLPSNLNYFQANLAIRCRCGQEYLTFLDKHIAATIKALNDRGYETQACCEGHYQKETDNYTFERRDVLAVPYISFCEPLSDVMLDSLPPSWYLDNEYPYEKGNIIRADINYHIPKAEFGSKKAKALEDIYRWVFELSKKPQ